VLEEYRAQQAKTDDGKSYGLRVVVKEVPVKRQLGDAP
jgi:hypothetical protein